jgi:hypothetical protein
MSIVAVHGPNTFGGTGAGGGGTGMTTPSPTGLYQATADPTNGLKFTFTVLDKGARPAADFDWTFPGGTPASQADSYGPVVVTFATAGAKNVSLAVAAGAGPPATGTYPMTVQAVSGPRAVQEEAPPEESQEPQAAATPPEESGLYDPGDHTIDEVKAYVEAHPDEAGEIYDAEYEGSSRSTLLTWLEARIPFDPSDHTVTEVIGYIEENPDQLDQVLAAERAGKNRSTLISQLEGMRTA